MKSEACPKWLREWHPGKSATISDFLGSHIVYYPGCGTDGQPVQYFGTRHAAHCFVYVDYGIPRTHILHELGKYGHPFNGYLTAGRLEVSERDLTPNGWLQHLQPTAATNGLGEAREPYAFLEILERKRGFDDTHGPQRLAILFLFADGVAAYDAIFCQAQMKAPNIVVLQDHGWGGNWTKFGRGGSLEQLASLTHRLPEFLLVAENTDAWAGYSVIEGAAAYGGGMHGFKRQMWQRDYPASDNPTEPQPAPSKD